MSTIKVATTFSRYPAGRFSQDGPFSGEAFRRKFLEPAARGEKPVIIELDGVRGYGSSFLEEAFGGLVRLGFKPSQLRALFDIRSERSSLIAEIWDYVDRAQTIDEAGDV